MKVLLWWAFRESTINIILGRKMQQNFPRKNVEKFTIVWGYFKPFNLILKQYYICNKDYLSTTLIYLKTVVNVLQQNFEINLALHSNWETNSVSSRITCYLQQTDTKCFFFACSQSWHILPCTSFCHETMSDVSVVIFRDFLSIFVPLFPIGRFRNDIPQMPYRVLDAIKTSPIISYLSTSTNLIWISWKIIEESYYFCWK